MSVKETNSMKSLPSIKLIGFGLVGTIFFGAFAYLLLTSEFTVAKGTDYLVGIIIKWLIIGLFLFFSFACLFMVLNIKTVILTDTDLIIKRLLILKKSIPYSNIKTITQGDFKINPKHRGARINVYNGEKTIIEFINDKKFEYNSFEISNYYFFNSELQRILKKRKNNKQADIRTTVRNNKFEGYGWLILIIILTFGLVYSIIKQRL